MSVELSIQAPLDFAYLDVLNAVREGLDRFSNRSEIEVTNPSEDEILVRHGEAIVQVTVSHFDYDPEEAGLWCSLDGGLFRDKVTYGLIVVIAEILASKLGGRIVDESLWLDRGRHVPRRDLEAIIKRCIGERVSEQSLGNLAIELNMTG
ncbi:hypothetical protein [Stieleria varia]|uniref:Uncharacterized protein n=1 Tax=Stieleria varia TaxID=2528005 RepID=A0A5C6AMM1_9BACT|nr:hypothetical protein [Stieleria varia]TWU00910.1 hypothetical protein Pla52n_42790 [Stieleria varia]